jgi:exosortase/archaeosortase family protein
MDDQPSPSTQRAALLTGAPLLGALLGALLFATLSVPTLMDMWHRWFPAWDQTAASWSHRLLGGDSYFAHGPLALLAAVALAIAAWRCGDGGEQRGRRIGWCLLTAALSLHALARWADVLFIAAFALLAVAAGAAMTVGGWRTLRRYGWALAIAAAAIPWPMVGIAQLNLAMKQLAIEAAMWLAGPLTAGSIARHGSYVVLMNADGHPGWHPGWQAESSALLIGSVCSGLRSLVAILFTAMLFAAVCRLRGRRCALLIAAALPLALLFNILRVAVLIVGASWWGVAVAGEGGWLHDWTGPAMFLGVLGTLGLLESALHRPARVQPARRQPAPHRHRPSVPPSPHAPWAAAGLLLIAVAVAPMWATGQRQGEPPPPSRLLMPAVAIEIDDQLLTAAALPVDDQTRRWLASGRWCYERFTPADTDAPHIGRQTHMPIDLLIVETGRRRDLLHPPEVCLIGRGDELLHRVIRRTGDLRAGDLRVVELLGQRGPARELHVFVYQLDDAHTTSFALQHARMLAAPTRNGRLIRLTTPLTDEPAALDVARDRLDAALGAVIALVERGDAANARLAGR